MVSNVLTSGHDIEAGWSKAGPCCHRMEPGCWLVSGLAPWWPEKSRVGRSGIDPAKICLSYRSFLIVDCSYWTNLSLIIEPAHFASFSTRVLQMQLGYLWPTWRKWNSYISIFDYRGIFPICNLGYKLRIDEVMWWCTLSKFLSYYIAKSTATARF